MFSEDRLLTLALRRAWCLSKPFAETYGVPSAVARASALSSQTSASQAQLLLQLLDARQVFLNKYDKCIKQSREYCASYLQVRSLE